MKLQLHRIQSMETFLTPLTGDGDKPLGVCRDLVVHTATGDFTIQFFAPTIDELMLPPNDPSLTAALRHARLWNASYAKALARIATLADSREAEAIARDALGSDLDHWLDELEQEGLAA